MKRILIFLAALAALTGFAANPSFQSFSTADFGTNALTISVNTNKFATRATVTNIVQAIGGPASTNPPAGTVYPSQFGAAGNGSITTPGGLIGLMFAATVNGTDDSAALNTMFNSITNGTTVEGQNKIYFVNSQVNCTNANLIKVQNFWFATTNKDLVTFNACTVGAHFKNLIFVGTSNTVSSCAVSNDWYGNFTDYGVNNTWENIVTKGGFKYGIQSKHQSNTRYIHSTIGNCSSNNFRFESCDQNLVESCQTGYAFDAYGGTISGELGGGGNISWSNGIAAYVEGGIGTTFLNCEHNTGGSFLWANGTSIRFIGCDFEQFFAKRPICVLTNSKITCSGGVNFICNEPGALTNLTTWQLNGCNLSACIIDGSAASTYLNIPFIDIFAPTANGHDQPQVIGQYGGLVIRTHAVFGDSGTDAPIGNGNVAMSSQQNYWRYQNYFSNSFDIINGNPAGIQLGADRDTLGKRTAGQPKRWSVSMPSFGSAVPDTVMIGGDASSGNTVLSLGSDSTSAQHADTLWFQAGGGLTTWDATTIIPFTTLNVGNPAHPLTTAISKSFVVETNAFTGADQIVALALPTSGCILVMSNATLYAVCTNQIGGTGVTITKVGGL